MGEGGWRTQRKLTEEKEHKEEKDTSDSKKYKPAQKGTHKKKQTQTNQK